MRREIKFCQRCFNVADTDTWSICANNMRKQEVICVVENFPVGNRMGDLM